MRILGRYVFREILAGSFLATIIATFVIFLQRLGRLFEPFCGLICHGARVATRRSAEHGS